MFNAFVAFAFVFLSYTTLSIITRTEDKGVSFLWDYMKRKLFNHSKHFDGITYEPNAKNVQGMDFELKNLAQSEKLEKHKIPYLYHANDQVIKLKNGDLIATVKVAGIKFETEDYGNLALLKEYRNNMLIQFGSRIGMYVHYIRRQIEKTEFEKIANPIANIFLHKYHQHLEEHQKRFVNDIYVTLIIRAEDPNLTPFERLFGTQDKTPEKMIKDLETAMSVLTSMIERANPKRLGVHTEIINGKEVSHCEILTFLSYILNLESAKIPLLNEEIDNYLSRTRKIFKKDGSIQFNCTNGKTRLASVFGLPTNTYPSCTDHEMIDPFLAVQHEMIISMSYLALDKQASKKLAKDKQAFLTITDDDSISQTVDISQVRDDIASGHLLNGIFNFNVMVHATNGEDYKKAIEATRQAFSHNNLLPRREEMIAEPAYYVQLPGNYRFVSRAGVVTTRNFAGFASLHNTQTGQRDGNHWHDYCQTKKNGDYVMELTSFSHTPYFFNFHKGSLGHTRVVAPSGGGKTTLINALLTSSMKFDPYIFHFDYLHSAAPFMKCMGATHKTIMPNLSTGWNPFQLPDTEENRAFLYDFLVMLTSRKDSEGRFIQPSARESNTIQEVINTTYTLKPRLRRLRHIWPSFGIGENDNLSERLSKWIGNGIYGSIFDNEEDNFSVEGAKLFCFEMKHIIDNDELLPVAIMYIAHRIDQAMTKREPFIIVFEEGQRLVQNPVMFKWLSNLSTTVRRRNGLVIFITPTPEVITKDADLRQQYKTTILFPNPKASKETYCGEGGLGCTEKEFDFLVTEDPNNRKFLVKTDNDSVISSLDLSKMMEFVHVFSGTDEKYNYIVNLEQQYGANPENWFAKLTERFH